MAIIYQRCVEMRMADAAQVYLLGTKPCVERCLGALFLRETNTRKCTDVWTSFKSTKFRSDDDVHMQKLKNNDSDTGSDMECQDLDLCDSSDKSNTEGRNKKKKDLWKSSTPSLKRRKSSFNSCDGATGGHELDTVKSDKTEILGDIHAIVIDDEEGLNRRIAPFMFQFFLWPCLVVLAINNESSVDLYGDFLKELGFYAQLRGEETSKALVVYVPSQDAVSNIGKTIEDKVNSIQFRIFDNYFGEPFFSCQIDEIVNRVPLLLQKIGKQPRATISGKIIVNDKCSPLEQKLKQIQPEDLVNKFLKVLRKTNLKYKCKFSDILQNIPETELRKVFTDAFKDNGLIHREEDMCYILPFILCENTQSCDEEENELEMNDAVRLTVNSEIIPASLKVDILMIIQKEGWTVKSHGPNRSRYGDSYLCRLGRHSIVIEFGAKEKLSYIYLDLLKFDEQCSCQVEHKKEYFETLRKNIEAALKMFRDQLSADNDLMCITDRHILDKLDKNKWIKEEDLKSVNQLHPWFTSKEKKIEEERNRELSDRFLADISELFGENYKLFFVLLGVPHEKIRIIERDNESTKDSIYEILREWRKLEGPRASIAKLRSEIKESRHSTIDINRFNDIVKKHGLS